MADQECNPDVVERVQTAGTYRQGVITRTESIHDLQSSHSTPAALEAEHDAIEFILQSLWKTVVAGGERPVLIEILNAAINLCATHFADEEQILRKNGYVAINAHTAAHKELLAHMVAARRHAAGEGLSLGVLDAGDLLHDFHQHVDTFDRVAQTCLESAFKVQAPVSLGSS